MTDKWLLQLQSFFNARAKDPKMGEDDLALNGYKAPNHRSYWTEAVRRRLLEDIVGKLQLSPSHHVLDVGCGTGMILREIGPKVAYVTGIDFSAGMLAIARKHLPPNADLKQMNVTDLSFENETFDRVLCYSVITNFLDDAFTLSVLKQLVRVTRRGGGILIGNTPDEETRERQTELIEQQWKGRPQSLSSQSFPSSRPLNRMKNFLRNHLLHPASLGNRFYTKDFFIQFAQGASCEIEILPLEVEGYLYAPCRFDVRLWPLHPKRS